MQRFSAAGGKGLGRPRRRSPLAGATNTCALLRDRNCRRWYTSLALSISAFFIFDTATLWLIRSLTGDSGPWIGWTAGTTGIAVLALLPWSGSLGELPRRLRLLRYSHFAMAAVVTLLIAVTISGKATPWIVFGLALGVKLAGAAIGPASQTFQAEVVGGQPEDEARVDHGVALSVVVQQVAAIVGPAAAGFAMSDFLAEHATSVLGIGQRHGVGAALLLVIACEMGVLVALRGTRSSRAAELGRPPARTRHDRLRAIVGRVLGALQAIPRWVVRGAVGPMARAPLRMLQGVRTIGTQRALWVPLLTLAVICISHGGGKEVMFTKLAEGEAAISGLLRSAYGVGLLFGALLATLSRTRFRTIVIATIVLGGFYLATAAVGPSLVLQCAGFVGVGAADGVLVRAFSTTFVIRADREMRGRSVAAYHAVGWGFTALGAPLVGFAIDRLGSVAMLACIGSVVLTAAAVATAAILATTGASRAPIPEGSRDRRP